MEDTLKVAPTPRPSLEPTNHPQPWTPRHLLSPMSYVSLRRAFVEVIRRPAREGHRPHLRLLLVPVARGRVCGRPSSTSPHPAPHHSCLHLSGILTLGWDRLGPWIPTLLVVAGLSETSGIHRMPQP